jgi:HSP20 family molecular chaperone IbpA
MTTLRYQRRHVRSAALGTTERPGAVIEWWRFTGTVVVAPVAWRPRADVYETQDGVLVSVELAGVEAEDLDVQLFEDAVVVEGSRPVPEAFSDGRYHLAEIPRGRFRLRLALQGVVDPDRAEARFEAGLLELVMKRAEEHDDGR